MDNEKGFTLVEVLTSTVLLSIILTSFLQVFTSTDRIAVSNNEKLVVINLADAYLERLQIEKFTLIPNPSSNPGYVFTGTNIAAEFSEAYTSANCVSKNIACEFYSRTVNNRDYDITVTASQNKNEKDIRVVNVKVAVKASQSKISSSVEGYVSYDTR